MSKDFSYYVIDLGLSYDEDTDRATAIIKEVGAALKANPTYAPLILEPIEILGVDAFTDSQVMLKLRIKTLPQKQWDVGRELRRRIKIRFDEEGIVFDHACRHAASHADGGPRRGGAESLVGRTADAGELKPGHHPCTTRSSPKRSKAGACCTRRSVSAGAPCAPCRRRRARSWRRRRPRSFAARATRRPRVRRLTASSSRCWATRGICCSCTRGATLTS